jgi:hypothetical protein
MRHVLSILFGASFTLAACWATGKLLLARWKLEVFSEELQIFRFATGAALFSLLTLVLAAANLAYIGVFLAAGAALIAASFRVREPDLLPLPDFSHGWKFLFFLILIGFGIFYFINALAPEVSPDGSAYHLGLVARYFRQHGLGRITTSIYANLSEGLEMLFLVAFSFGRHSSAALIEFASLVGIPLVMIAYGQRFHFPKATVAAATIVFCSPVFGISGSSAYNDAAAVFTLLCLFYALQIWDETRQSGMLVVAGLLAGFCYGIKYSLFLAAPYALAFVLWKLIRKRQPILRPLIILCACAALTIAPWWIKNWITVRNPLSPFGNKIFSNPYVTPRFESDYLRTQAPKLPPVDRFLDTTIRGGSSSGFLGPLFLLAPLGLLALRYRQGRQVIFAAALFLFPALANEQTRFLMLCAPFVALAICLAVMRARGCLFVFACAAPLLAIPSVADNYCDSYAWRLNDFPLADALRSISEHDSLSKRLWGFQVAEMANRFVPPNGTIFSMGQPTEAYLTRDNIVSYESALGQTLSDILMIAADTDYQPGWILTFHFPERGLQKIRVVQTAAGRQEDEWSIGEFRLYRGTQPLLPGKQWKFSSNANPWDLAYAFDLNLVTRWRSRVQMVPGIFVQLDLGRAEIFDTVELQCSHDQWGIRLKLETEDKPGHWIEIAAAPTVTERPVNVDLRPAAAAQFKAHGITHILLNKDDYMAADVLHNPASWGLKLVGHAREDWLYKIE